jgi:hypothetical protein
MRPYEIDDDDQWSDELDRLDSLIRSCADTEVLAWFSQHVPRCMALIPRHQLHSFLGGVRRCIVDEGNGIGM